jgi:hypothetical protein
MSRLGENVRVTRMEDWGVCVDDDYNCGSAVLTKEEAIALRDWLIAEFPPIDCSCTPETIGVAVACMCSVEPTLVTVEVVP